MRLIDANELDTTTVATDDYSGNETLDVVLKEDVDSAPTVLTIPDNPTNGDMIKAMYPKGKIRREKSCTHDITVFSFPDGTYFGAECRFNTDWWNAPYKAESED